MRQNEMMYVDNKLIRSLCIIAAAFCLSCVFIFDKTKRIDSFTVSAFGICIIAAVVFLLRADNRLTEQNIFILLFAAGFLIRLNYILYTPVTLTRAVRQHDVWEFGSGMGHAGYIEHFYYNGFTLPNFNPITVNQFYHPPLHHFIAAMWMRFLTALGMEYDRVVSNIQYLTLFYSVCCILVSERILSNLNVKGTGKFAALSIVAFHPSFIILAGSINNDILSVLFILLAVNATVRWYRFPKMSNIIWVALTIGLGMMTKLSVALAAPPIAFVFLVKFIKTIRAKENWKNLFGQYLIFGTFSFPLGLWFYLRNYIIYGVPVNYVMRLSDKESHYLGNYTIMERLFKLGDKPFDNVFLRSTLYGDEYWEYNPIVTLVKTSIFGEYNYAYNNKDILFPAKALLWINIILIAISVAAMVYCVVSERIHVDIILRLFLLFYQVLNIVNYIVFSIQYPHTCSMDYRYIVPTCVIGAVYIGMLINHIDLEILGKRCELYDENNKMCMDCKMSNEEKNVKWLLKNIVKYAIITISVLFSVYSVTVYFMLGQ